ncbi:MAG: hypothetical protein AB8B92_05720 [Gammaproteobacteria bacterium]
MKRKSLRILSSIIYSLAAVNIVLFSILYYGMFQLSEEELEIGSFIAVNLWVDYLGWLFFAAVLPIFIRRIRKRFKEEAHPKATMLVCGDILPILLVAVMCGIAVKFIQVVF